MIVAVLHGILAATGVALTMGVAGAGASSPLGRVQMASVLGWLLILVLLVAIGQWLHSRGRTTPSEQRLEQYDGVPDLLIHLHSPALPDRSSRWAFRGLASWILTSLGFAVGPEGGASEFVQASAMRFRTTALRWSDLARRSDAAMALSAGISAAFGAPFAAVLVPSELAIGGRLLTSVLAALTAYLGMGYFTRVFSKLGIPALGYRERLEGIWGFRLLDWREWVLALAVVVVVSVLASGLLVGLRQVRRSAQVMARGLSHRMTLLAGVLLASLVILAPQFLLPLPTLLEQVVRRELPIDHLFGLAGFLFLTLVAIGAGMGSMGIWWPTWLLGATLATAFLSLAPHGWVSRGFLPNAALLGAVAFGAVWLKAPISLAVLAFEFTQNGSMLLPCLVSASIARWIYFRLGESAWIDQLLVAKGFPIEEGRAVAVLQSLTAGDAMVRNFDTVDERDSVRNCHEKIRNCHYPFLPVVDVHGRYKGLLTVDLIENVLFSQETELPAQEGVAHAHEKLAGLLEAKDLLYRSGIQAVAVGFEASLADIAPRLRGQSCLPVVDSESRVVGLIFDHDVRQCYDREVARRSFVMQANQNSRLQGRRQS